MDVLSDVLLSVRLNGAVFFDVDAHAPFATESPGVGEIGSQVLPGAEHVISFHIVTDGSCWAEAVDQSAPPVPLRAGDIVVFPAGKVSESPCTSRAGRACDRRTWLSARRATTHASSISPDRRTARDRFRPRGAARRRAT